MTEAETVWHVQVEGEGVKIWTLDQLDAAYKAGLVDDATYVFEDGASEWLTLGVLLGGGDDDEDEEAAPVPQTSQMIPQTIAMAPVHSQSIAPASLTPQSLAPQAFTPQSFAPTSFAPQSTEPMVSDLDDLDAPVAFRSKKRGWAVAAGVALVAAGVAVAGFKFGTTATEPPPPVAAVAPPPAAPEVPPPPAGDLKSPAQAAADAAQRLNDDQRRALLEADKVREAKTAEKQKARAAASPHHRSKHEKGPFHEGGDKYDPLNAKL
jgi:hypothetical protein